MAAVEKRPLQIYLRADQLEALRALARRRGGSMAELVREGVDQVLDETTPEEDPLMGIVGIFDSGLDDLAQKHDEHLARVMGEEGAGAT